MSQATAPRSELFGWAMFDFANSSYTTVIVTVVYSVVFPRLIVADGPDFAQGNLLWSVALSISYALCVVSAPVLGALMDHAGHRKRWLLGNYLFTVGATALLYFGTPDRVWLAMLLIVLSNYAFAVGESFAASFLPELGPPDVLGKISGAAWGLGYMGGLCSTALVIFGLGPQTAENFDNMRLVGPVTAGFFFLAGLPTFLLLRERAVPRPLPPGETWLSVGFSQLASTLRALRDYRDLVVFFVSFFFAMAGLSIVISFAFIYGDQVIHWSPTSQTLMFVITQLTGAAGALTFGRLQARLGDVRTYGYTLLLWTVTVLAIAFATRIAGWLGLSTEHFFLFVGALAGSALGATQSAARTIVALFSPASRSGEFFGLWGMFGKTAAIVGLLSLGLLQAALGLENAILVCGAFFLLAFVVVRGVDVERARANAARAERP